MQEILTMCVEILKNLVTYDNIIVSMIMGMLIVIIESIIPVLPLGVFIAINTLVMGNLLGFIISWIGTLIGCSISYYIFRYGFNKYIYGENKDIKSLKLIKMINKLKFSSLVLIAALPFTPAFSVNIAAGIAKLPYKKFILAMMISKVFIIYFWGYIGTTLIESIQDISVIIKIVVMLIIAYVVSTIVNRKYKLD